MKRQALLLCAVVSSLVASSLAAQSPRSRDLVQDSIPLSNWAVPFEQIRVKVMEAEPLRIAERSLHPSVNAVPSAASHFITIVPCRIVDTRLANGTYGGPKLVGGASRTFNVPGGPCTGIPTSAAAFSLNFTVLNGEGSSGFLTAYPTGSTRPTVSTLNYGIGNLVANAAIVPSGTSTSIDVYVNYNVDIIIDINGYFVEGVVTNLNPGTGMTGGGTGNVTLGLMSGGVTSTQLGPNAVTTGAIQDNAVTGAKIASGQVVKSLNSLNDAVTLTGTNGATVSTTGNTIQINAPPSVQSGSVVLGTPADTTLIGAGYTEIGSTTIEAWGRATSLVNAPVGRIWFGLVWTGTKMIVWGGRRQDGTRLNNGGQFDPATNSWTPTTTTGAPTARELFVIVWTNSKMIVWGGDNGPSYETTGGLYDPVADSWVPTSTSGVPEARINSAAVWTGTYMVVWGGYGTAGALNNGGRYNPATNTWLTMTATNAPSIRDLHSAVWSNSRMIVWGGRQTPAGPFLNTGGLYDPSADTWTATATTGAPTGRWAHTAIWTGTQMIVWAGYDQLPNATNSGGIYVPPPTDTWSATSTVSAPDARFTHSAVWTGTKMIVWGGFTWGVSQGGDVNTGSFYDPFQDSWSSMSTGNAPAARDYHGAIWTGSRMIVWGGEGPVSFPAAGGQWVKLSLYQKN